MNFYFSRVPEAAVHRQFDGHFYAYVPHKINQEDGSITEDFDNPRMMRYAPPSFIKGGEAYIHIGTRGDALPVPSWLPFGVTVMQLL